MRDAAPVGVEGKGAGRKFLVDRETSAVIFQTKPRLYRDCWKWRPGGVDPVRAIVAAPGNDHEKTHVRSSQNCETNPHDFVESFGIGDGWGGRIHDDDNAT
jgi:hypothetical protein